MLRIPRRFSLSNPNIIVSVVDFKEDIILLYKLIVFSIDGLHCTGNLRCDDMNPARNKGVIRRNIPRSVFAVI